MWGVNIPSTLAGMIANSLSFPIMLLAIAGAWRDAEDGHFRLRTVWLFVALLASHFFTSVMAALAVAAIPLLRAPRGFRRAVSVLAREGGLAVLLMAWWLVPLAAKSDYSMEFGTNWAVTLRNTLPPYVPALLPLVLLAPVLALLRGARAVWLFVWMFGAAAFLFVAGFALAPVFVNVRLWPFLFFGLLALAAAGLGLLAHGRRAPELLALAALVAGLAGVQAGERSAAPQAAAPIAPCARWNYEGMERKPYASVVRDLVLPLRETPGRLANDLHDDNGALGSSRFFEAVPHLTGKPVLEGGLVNSAAGALFSYYVQGETSRASAGYPTLVKPATFNLAHATAHLRLFNVKHFIARWPPLREALARAPEWRRLRSAAGWDLYELTTHDGRYVRVPARLPVAVETRRWKEYALEWLYTFEALDQPFVFIKPGEGAAVPSPVPPLSEAQFRRVLAHWRPSRGDVCEWLYLGPFPCPPHAADPLAFRPVDEDRLEPVEGERAFGRTWRLLFGRGSITPDPCARGREHGVGYGGVNVFAPSAREARLEFAQDDAVAIWLNGERVAGGGRTGPGRFESVAVRLTRGRNRLRLKHYQATGGAFFHVRITDPDGAPFPDLVCSVENEPPVVPELPGPEPRLFGPSVSAEQVADDRIRFRTDAPRAPHLIACTYYPNWKVRGAARVFMVTPAFMLVYPEGEDVELYYGATVADTAGRLLALAGAVLAAALVLRRPGPRRVLGRCVSRVAWLKFLDATAGFCLCWAAGYLRFWLIRRAPPPTACVGDHVRRLLVVRPGGLGDMVLLIPVLRRLEAGFPGAALDIVCERRNLDVLRLAGLDSRALLYDAHPLRLLARLLTHRYDAAVDTEQFHYFSALIAALSRAPVRIGFKINPGRNLLYTHLVTYALDGYEGDQFLRLLAPLGAAGAPCAVEGCLRDAATAALSDADAAALDRTAAAGPLVALGAGSSLPLKQWPVSRFAGLARRLADEDGAGVVLLGGAGDRRVCRAVLGELRAGGDPDSRPVHPAGAAIPARATTARREPDTADGGRIVSFAGRLSLSQTATVLRRCRVFVSGDSGLAHLALALGTPAVVLFGPSDPLKWGHATGLGRVVRHPVACAPCCIFGYHKLCRTAHCMGGIAVEPVRAACREFL
jgi:ADP-heptose:LPS heptosyltransferase